MGTFRHPSGQWMTVPDAVIADYTTPPTLEPDTATSTDALADDDPTDVGAAGTDPEDEVP